MAAKIEIVVGVNNTQANAALKKTQQELVSTGKAVQGLDQKLAGGLVKGSNSATLALTNLGRVAQDAPFGFVGIANNLNPLLESFQRLKAESGSTGGALKALTSSLMGAGGFGLALSAITAIVSFASIGFSSWTRGLKGGQEALDANAKSAKAAADSYKSIVESVAQEVSSAAILVESFKKENLTRQEKINIIEKLQKISPAYFSNLNKENTTVNQLVAAYDAYSRSIVRTIELKIREQQLTKVIERRIELQDKGSRKTEQFVSSSGKLIKAYNVLWDPNSNGQKKFGDNLLLFQNEQDELNSLIKTEAQLLTGIANLKQPQDFLELEKTGAKVKSVTEDFGELKKVILDVSEIRFYEKGKFDEFLKNVKPDSKVFNKVTIPIKPEISLPDLEKSIEKIEADITPLMEQMGANIGTSLGESIGNAISGSGGFENAFQGIIMVLASGLKEVGKLLIQTGVKMAIAKAALDKIRINPYLAIAAGIALVALGTAAQNSFNKKKGFARGGLVPGVGNTDSVDAAIMPGEFVLRKSAVQAIGPTSLSLMNAGVMPAGNISAGSQRVEIVGEGSISGETIYIAYKRYEQRRGRTT